MRPRASRSKVVMRPVDSPDWVRVSAEHVANVIKVGDDVGAVIDIAFGLTVVGSADL